MTKQNAGRLKIVTIAADLSRRFDGWSLKIVASSGPSAVNAHRFMMTLGVCDMADLMKLFFEANNRHPSGNVQDELRRWAAEQITITQTENERVRQANLDVMMHFEDMKAAKEQAEARCAELTEALTITRDNMIDWSGYVDKYFLDKHDLSGDIAVANKALGFNHLMRPPTSPFVLRKQAEAVEAYWHSDCREIPEIDDKALLREDMLDAVRSLRQQADELERQSEGGRSHEPEE